MTPESETTIALITYSIQYRRGMCDPWRSDGLGDADGWPTQEAARAAIVSLGDKGEDWHGEYRIVEMPEGLPVEHLDLPISDENAAGVCP
jgi:hypothetical protein